MPKWNTGRARRVPRGLRGWTITWRPLPTTGAGGAGTRKATTGQQIYFTLAKVGDQIDFGPCFQPAMICRFKSQVCLSLPVTSGTTHSLEQICTGGVRSGSPSSSRS